VLEAIAARPTLTSRCSNWPGSRAPTGAKTRTRPRSGPPCAPSRDSGNVIGVLGISAGLGDHLARHPEDCCLLRGADAIRRPTTDELRAALLYAVGANPLHEDPVADLAFLDGTDPAAALCVAYKRHILPPGGAGHHRRGRHRGGRL